MEYTVHGRKFVCSDDECGIYKDRGIMVDYAVMDKNSLIAAINRMGFDLARNAVGDLRNMAAEQVTWKSVPRIIGFPILREPDPTPIEQVRGNLQNTLDLTDGILKLLE